MSYILRSRPTVAAIYRMLPADLKTLLVDSGICDTDVRESITLLLAAKEAYCSSWNGLNPTFTAGNLPNVPRPTPAAVLFAAEERRRINGRDRREYQAAYRARTKERRAAYTAANRERVNQTKRERAAIRRAIDEGTLVVADENIKTVWR